MDSDRFRQIDNLLEAVLAQPPAERDRFLRRVCAGDQGLEAEVRSLLDSAQRAGNFLESPALEIAAKALAADQGRGAPQALPSCVGRYRIVSLLGEGGMGV